MSTFDIPWSALIDTAPDGWCVLDAEGRVRYANAAALTLLGLPAPTGVSISEWLSDLNAKNRDLMLGAIQERGQVRLQLPDAQHPYLLFEAGPLPGVAGTLARVRRDHEVEASEIIAITIHELRKPMTSITGYAQMMLGLDTESLSDMQRQFLDTINRNVQRLNSDLFTVQDMTRIDRGKVQLTPTRQSPARIATLVLDELRPLLEKKGHHVTLDFPEDLPPVRADAERFEQVLRILLDNALKYTPPNGQIRVGGHAAGVVVQLDVRDNGIGIPPAEQGKIFTKFFRGEDERIYEYTGLGLNLYIARGLVQLQGGRLWFESKPDRGSTFSFTLPVWGADGG